MIKHLILILALSFAPLNLKSQWKVKKDGNPFDGEILSAFTVGTKFASANTEPILVINTYVDKGGINFYLSGLDDRLSKDCDISFAINGKIYKVKNPEVSEDGSTIFFKEIIDSDLLFGTMQEDVFFNLFNNSKNIDIRVVSGNEKIDCSFNGANFSEAINELFPEKDLEKLYAEFLATALINDSIGRVKGQKIANLMVQAEDSLGVSPDDLDHIKSILIIQAGLDERAFIPQKPFEVGQLKFKYNCKYSSWTDEKTISLYYELNGELEEISDSRAVTDNSYVYKQFYSNRESLWRMFDPINANPLDGLDSKLSIPFIIWDLNKTETTFKYDVLDNTERLIYSSDLNLNLIDIAKVEIKLSDSKKWQVSSFELVVITKGGEILKDTYCSITNDLMKANLKALNVRGGDLIQLNF